MACRLLSAKPLSESMLQYCQLDPQGTYYSEIYLNFKNFHSNKCTWTCRLRNGGHFVSTSMCKLQRLFHETAIEVREWMNNDIPLFDVDVITWWRHQMETFSALLALCAGNSPVTGEFPSQRPVPRRFDVFFDLRLNKRFRKPSGGWWFETPSWSLWRQCNVSQTTVSNAFPWMKMLEFLFKFNWNLILWVQLAISQHWFR